MGTLTANQKAEHLEKAHMMFHELSTNKLPPYYTPTSAVEAILVHLQKAGEDASALAPIDVQSKNPVRLGRAEMETQLLAAAVTYSDFLITRDQNKISEITKEQKIKAIGAQKNPANKPDLDTPFKALLTSLIAQRVEEKKRLQELLQDSQNPAVLEIRDQMTKMRRSIDPSDELANIKARFATLVPDPLKTPDLEAIMWPHTPSLDVTGKKSNDEIIAELEALAETKPLLRKVAPAKQEIPLPKAILPEVPSSGRVPIRLDPIERPPVETPKTPAKSVQQSNGSAPAGPPEGFLPAGKTPAGAGR